MPESHRNTDRALVASSLWLHVGFVGACALAAGLIQLFDGQTTWLSALSLGFCGGALATAGWRRGRSILDRAERMSAVSADAPAAQGARVSSKQPGRGGPATLSPISLLSNQRREDDLRHPPLQ
jgi:hypothetical protein